MEEFKKYIKGEANSIDTRSLSAVIGRWEWFLTPRIILSPSDERLTLHRLFHGCTPEQLDPAEIKLAYNNCVIDRFLNAGDYKIDTEADAADAAESRNFEPDDDELLTEELAEVYLAQGLFEQAIQIYRRLSLLYPKKSIYFAELIEQANTKNKQLK